MLGKQNKYRDAKCVKSAASHTYTGAHVISGSSPDTVVLKGHVPETIQLYPGCYSLKPSDTLFFKE